MIQPFRIEPKMPPGAYKSYRIDSPRDTTVRAACAEVGCAAWRNGWDTVVDESTDLGRAQAAYIRQRSGRTFRETRTAAGADALTVFRFESGQRCFADHKTRPETYTVRGGDWRAQTGPTRTHSRPVDWVEDFAEHQDRLAEQTRKG